MRGFWDRLERMSGKTAIRSALRQVSRERILQALQWNDRNGCYTDRLAKLEGFEPITKRQAIEMVVETIDNSVWHHKDPRRQTNPGKKRLTQRNRNRIVTMAERATEKECRRRRLPCWRQSGDGYTAKAQEIFNRAYDYYEAEILSRR